MIRINLQVRNQFKLYYLQNQSRFPRIVAGAGKTETLTRRNVYLLASGVAPESLVAFIFSEKVASSMKERIYSRVGRSSAHRLPAVWAGCSSVVNDDSGTVVCPPGIQATTYGKIWLMRRRE